MEYIKTNNPDIIMLALGIPLQEKLINKHIDDFKKGIFIVSIIFNPNIIITNAIIL